MRKSAREKLADAKAVKHENIVLNSLDDFLRLLLGGECNPTQHRFIYSDSFSKGYMGPAGCAKTSTICAAGLARALLQPGCKGLVARSDYNDLIDTTALRFQEMVNRLPRGVILDRDKLPPMKWWIRPIGGLDSDDISQITFMGLKDNLGSYEFDWAIIDEADQIEEKQYHLVKSRLRHGGGKFPFSLMLAFNPPDKKHWLYTESTGLDYQEQKVKEPTLELFVPQPKENQKNLPPGYYENLEKTLPPELVDRLVRGLWGSIFMGVPVYRQFKEKIHAASKLAYDPYSPIIRFWDFGYNRPYCGWAQIDFEGRFLVLGEKLGCLETADQFVARCMSYQQVHFPGARIARDFGDPAARQKKDTGSTLAILSQAGIQLNYTLTSLDVGLKITRRNLDQMISGEPSIQVDPMMCPILVDALRGGYHYKESTDPVPQKDGFYEHPADAFRYGVVGVRGLGGMTPFGDGPDNLGYKREFDAAWRH